MKFQGAFNSMFKTITARHRVYKYQNKKNNDKQLNIIPIYNDIFMSGTHGVAGCVCVGWGRLGVCGSAVVPLLWRLGGFGAVVFGNTAELGLEGARDYILYDEIYVMIIEQ